jgi:hypothetical protein
MVSFGAIVVEPGLERTFSGRLHPISDEFVAAALPVSNLTREETLGFPNASDVMHQFAAWVDDSTEGRPMFISDNKRLRLAVHDSIRSDALATRTTQLTTPAATPRRCCTSGMRSA